MSQAITKPQSAERIDAMMMYSNKGFRAWLVRGDKSVCIDPGQNGSPIDAGGPGGKPGPLTLAERWPSLPPHFRTGIDAMMMYSNNGFRAWLVRGNQSVCIDPGQDGSPINAGGPGGKPGPLTLAERWPSLPAF